MSFQRDNFVVRIETTTQSGSGILKYNTLTDLQNAYPNGTDSPVWIISENSWYYWNGSSTSDTTAPNDVTNLTSTPGETSVALSWTASNSTDIASYDVYNGTTLLGNVTTTSYNATGLTASTSYTFTVKAKDTSGNLSTGVSVTTTTTATSTFSPSNIAGLYTWFDATKISGLSDGALVTQWNDESGTAKHGVQADSTKQPTYKVAGINSKASIEFIGGKLLDVTNGLPSGAGSSFTILSVQISTDTTGYRNIYSANANLTGSKAFLTYNGKPSIFTGTGSLQSATNVPSGTFVMSATHDGSTNAQNLYTNGSNVITGTATEDSLVADAQIGGFNKETTNNWKGQIGEIIVYNSALSDADRKQVEQYLADKWGVTLVA